MLIDLGCVSQETRGGAPPYEHIEDPIMLVFGPRSL
jgi:hypothetical protein